jgi:hypothetical protein
VDLHKQFEAYLKSENLDPQSIELLAQKTPVPSQTRHVMEHRVMATRKAFYEGAQACINVMVEVSSKPGLDAADVSTAMVRLQRQTQEGMS